MKKTTFFISRRNDTVRKRRNHFLLLTVRRYEHPRRSARGKEEVDIVEGKVEDDVNCEPLNSGGSRGADIVRYYDSNNKSVIRTTNYILREHLRECLFINQNNTFFNYFYNSYPHVINKYVSHATDSYPVDGKGEESRDKLRNGKVTSEHSIHYDGNNFLYLMHYYNKRTKREMEKGGFLHLVKEKVKCVNSATELLKGMKDNIYLTDATEKSADPEICNNLRGRGELLAVLQRTVDAMNDTNDVNKKVEILLYLTMICEGGFFPSIYEHVRKNIHEIYEHVRKKNKKGVEEQYIQFLLYKEFLSSKSEKYIKMEVKNYLMDEISFYNFLKNENIHICLLSLIYRDLSFLNDYEVKYVLMNLAFSKMKMSDFFDSVGRGGNGNGNGISIGGDLPSDSLLAFLSNSLLRNNFFSFLKRDCISHPSSTINYVRDVNITNVNNYVMHNLLVALIQLKESHYKCIDLIERSKMTYFIEYKKNTTLLNFIYSMKDKEDYLNKFIMNNITFFTKHLVKLKWKNNFPHPFYLYILNIYCCMIDMLKNRDHYTDLKKKKNILSDCKKIVNYVVNEMYNSLNMYTLKEFVTLVKLIKKLPTNFTFELKNELHPTSKGDIKGGFHIDMKKGNSHLYRLLEFNEDGLSSQQGTDTFGMDDNKVLSSQKDNQYDGIKYKQDEKNVKEEKKGDNGNKNVREETKQMRGGLTQSIVLNDATSVGDKSIQSENIPDRHMYNIEKNNFKMKKNSTIISRQNFIVLLSLSLFNEISDEFILKIKNKEFHLVKEKIPSISYHEDELNYVNDPSHNCNDLYEYIYKNHYLFFLNNSELYLDNMNKQYDQLTREQIVNYFIFFTHVSQLDISDLCELANLMNEINKFQPFSDFFISKRVDTMLRERWHQGQDDIEMNGEMGEVGLASERDRQIGVKQSSFQSYEFTDTYLDDYITNMKEKKEDMGNKISTVWSNKKKDDYNSAHYAASNERHFSKINLSTHSVYAANFEKHYYDYDIYTSTINLFLSLDNSAKTKQTIAKYLTFIDFDKVNIFKINFNHFLQRSSVLGGNVRGKGNSELYLNKQEIVTLGEHATSYMLDNFPLHIEYDNSSQENNHLSSYSRNGKIMNNSEGRKYQQEDNKMGMNDHLLDYKIIYRIVEGRIKYDINLKNYLLYRENRGKVSYEHKRWKEGEISEEGKEYDEEEKHFFEREILSLVNITSLINYINRINDDIKYMKLLTLCLKNIILCRQEIVEINTYRLITNILLRVKNMYIKIYISSEYSYLNMLIKYYINDMEKFIPFFSIYDYLQVMQIFIKYDLSENYLKYLIILNNELNKININNLNSCLVHIILYFFLKLNYVNEVFINNLLKLYANSVYQQINYINKNVITNVIKTNDMLLSLCIKNRDILNLNYAIIQKFGNFSNNFKPEDDLNGAENSVGTNVGEDGIHDTVRTNVGEDGIHDTARTIVGEDGIHDTARTIVGEDGIHNTARTIVGEDGIHDTARTNVGEDGIHDTDVKRGPIFNDIPSGCVSQEGDGEDDHYTLEEGEKILVENAIDKLPSENIQSCKNADYHIAITNEKGENNNLPHMIYERKNNKDLSKNNLITQKKYTLSLVHKLYIIYFLCKFHFYNDMLKSYYLQMIGELIHQKNITLNDDDYCKLYEIYVHVILNFYFLSFNKNNKYINYILSNLPCYYWYKREEEKLNLYTSSKEHQDINSILKLLNINFLTPTLTEIYFVHYFNDVKKIHHSLEIPENVLHLYKKYNLIIDDIRCKNVSILCVPEENMLR
ncbi:conserved Plasmodium protein, unknown function [Plasmodium ovale]|uniref:Uncharacterized protein n=1 Tax=Plasmodium ovale TaxID=36330 RepID=A0A1C3KGJ6_PLAOA|nr:conserved Plasmodium protein, unknown function [Plasmodium ovale]